MTTVGDRGVIERWSGERLTVAGLLIVASMLCLPLFAQPSALPVTADPDAFNDLSHVGVLVDAARRFGEYPLWNPYYGGGIPWAGSVYNPGLSPQSLLFVLAGEVVGLKLWVLAVLAGGTLGMYGSLREWLRLSRGAAMFGALLYVTAPWLHGVLAGGDYDHFGMFALPLLLLAFRRLLTGGLLGLLAPLGITMGLADAAKWWPFISAGCVLWLALALRHTLPEGRQRVRTIVVAWFAVVAVGVLLASPKLLPLTRLLQLDRVQQFAEREWELCYSSWAQVLAAASEADGPGSLRITVGVPALCLIAIALARTRRVWGVAALFATSALIAMGPASPVPVVAVASRVPVVRDMGSYGMYFSLPMLVSLVLLSAVGAEWVLDAGRNRSPRVARIAVLALAFLVLAGPMMPTPIGTLLTRVPLVRSVVFRATHAGLPALLGLAALAALITERMIGAGWTWRPDVVRAIVLGLGLVVLADRAIDRYVSMSALFGEPPAPAQQQPFHQVSYAPLQGVVSRYRETPARLGLADQYRNLKRNVGTITWLGNMVLPEHAIAAALVDHDGRKVPSPSYRGEVFQWGPGRVSLGEPVRTYNTITVPVGADGPAEIVLNTNCTEGWSASVGRTGCRDGLLAVAFDRPVADSVVLRFSDARFTAGCWIALSTLGLWLAFAPRWSGR